MKNMIKIWILACVCFGLSGCNTFNKALILTQSIEGTGSVTVESRVQLTAAIVENARQENGKFKADKIDITHLGKLTGTRVHIHMDNYGRPVLEEEVEGK